MSARDAQPSHIDHVVGVFARDSLSAALAATHRAGFGPQTRVFDGARAETGAQLERTGLRVLGASGPPPSAVLIVVTAPGRTAIVFELFQQLGAEAVYLAARTHSPALRTVHEDVVAPDIRLGEAPETVAEP